MSTSITIGIDIGGSHITAGVVDLESKQIIERSIVREHLDTQGNLEQILSTWTNVIRRSASFVPAGKLRLGMAMPGPFDYEEGISMMVGQNKYDAFYGLNVKQLLAARLGIDTADILMMNDASCFLKGELYGGAAQHYQNVIGLTLGTGLGSAKYNFSYTYDAELWCFPFHDSIVEDYLSTRWFIKRFKERSGIDVKNVKDLVWYTENNADANEVFKEFGTNLGLFLIEFIKMENPEVVVIGGNISKAFDLFIGQTIAMLADREVTVPVLRGTLGENAAIIGAGSLWANVLTAGPELS
ncbi:ROK family protein [Hufsiella ginkgonis]|uniref:ROK family protein n=1 Tax=Hufsiella ginkgonis TaxID=2695274 RepID=A0A7K1Y305_9SPHI|nr:ROK family protein [Hufsiella ginkgonis]MXV17674.1 ROK family protein [Hufsiella ginkgonis]